MELLQLILPLDGLFFVSHLVAGLNRRLLRLELELRSDLFVCHLLVLGLADALLFVKFLLQSRVNGWSADAIISEFERLEQVLVVAVELALHLQVYLLELLARGVVILRLLDDLLENLLSCLLDGLAIVGVALTSTEIHPRDHFVGEESFAFAAVVLVVVGVLRDLLIKVISAVLVDLKSLALVRETHEDVAIFLVAVGVELEFGAFARRFCIEVRCAGIFAFLNLVVLLLEELACAVALLTHIPELHLVFLAELGRLLADAVVNDGRILVQAAVVIEQFSTLLEILPSTFAFLMVFEWVRLGGPAASRLLLVVDISTAVPNELLSSLALQLVTFCRVRHRHSNSQILF